eukprot:m.112859 g.112859  ORF g.112859 m.112859 type:complete len:440 (-) comp17046_c0_seq1:44-1363(-)
MFASRTVHVVRANGYRVHHVAGTSARSARGFRTTRNMSASQSKQRQLPGWAPVAGIAAVGTTAIATAAAAIVSEHDQENSTYGKYLASFGQAILPVSLSQASNGKVLFPAKVPYLDKAISTDLQHRLDNDNSDYQARMEDMILRAQAEIVRALEKEEGTGAKFIVDRHERANGEGGGITTVMQDGKVFEKAGVNVSVIRGDLKPGLAKNMNARGKEIGPGPHKFCACGISSVIHPRNPMVPTMHFNYRYFEVTAANGKKTWWFGGGTDLTPYYLIENDVVHFHKTLKDACGRHDSTYYGKFKKWCDEYFRITHRKECRGVGGVFFDDLDELPQESLFAFASDLAASVIPAYVPLVNKRKNASYTQQQRDWQLLRRGRYVEFNLVYDRGTKFGLVTPQARIESIFISLPLLARWEYRHEPEAGSEEEKLLRVLQTPIEWV